MTPGQMLLLCGLLHGAPLIGAEKATIRSIHFQGNRLMSDRQLLNTMVLKPASPFSHSQLTSDLESLCHRYHQEGYHVVAVNVDSLSFESDSAGVDLFLGVEEGEREGLGEIHIDGNTAFTEAELLQQCETQAGGILVQEVLERDMNNLLARYERMGYPFAQVSVDSISRIVSISSTVLRLNLRIVEGPRVTIEEVRIAGNKETKDRVIVREARVKLHEIFDGEQVGRIPSRLNRLNIFSQVSEPELFVNSSRGGLLIHVQEGNTNTFDGVIGYAPAASGDEGIVTGIVNVTMRNLFGTARKLHLHWLRDERNSQEVAAHYTEPWVFDLPVTLSGGITQRQQDTIYVRRGFEARAELLVTESFSVSGIFTQDNIIPSANSNAVFESRTITAGIELTYDTRDDLLAPTSGINYHNEYHIGRKRTAGLSTPAPEVKANTTIQRLSFDADYFVSPLPRQVVALSLHARQLTSDHIELGDLYRFGGTRTIRGYRENQFLGSRLAWSNVEYRFLLARRSFVYGFLDNGYYFLPGDDGKNISSTQSYKYGVGFGIQLETTLGNVGVSFALGQGDPFSQAKIHFGLINEF